MGYEVKYTFHPRKEEGGYDTEVKDEKTVKVGKPFDDTPLEKCAAAIMAQLARRDVWVVDVEVCELVKKKISFKEAADGKGIVLKNKRFSLNSTAQMVAEDIVEEVLPETVPEGMQPHEMMQHRSQSNLYDANAAVPVKRTNHAEGVDASRVMYQVYFDPEIIYVNEVKNLGLKFTEDRKYPVHKVVPSPSGRLDAQKIVVTDDTGRLVTVDEKFFTSAGRGLLLDKQLGFSGDKKRGEKRPKLAYEDELTTDAPAAQIPEGMENIPIDDGTVPADAMAMPDIRSK
jgi:hypothetical protein